MDSSINKSYSHPSYDKWKRLFHKYDTEGFGRITSDDFLLILNTKDFREGIDSRRRAQLKAKVLEYGTSFITLEEFLNVMNDKYLTSSLRQSFSIEYKVNRKDINRQTIRKTCFDKMVKAIGHHFLEDERDRKYYADSYSCRPPPLFIIIITLIELSFFTYYTAVLGGMTSSGPVPIDSMFIYRPDKRSEIWRFFFYMVLHAGWIHLIFNLLVQILVGLPLEMVHGSARIGTVYMAGVLAGSLGTSVFDSEVYLVGASGGVYALLAAHLANVVLNYNQMESGLLRVLAVFFVASTDVGIAIFNRYSHQIEGPVSYVAHLTGALAGLTIGLIVLKNFEQKLHEQLMWWIALGVYTACILFAVLYNVYN